MITSKQLIGEVRKVAFENPTYIYNPEGAESCSYLTDADGNKDGQVCLIGQAFKNLNIEVPESFQHHGIGELIEFESFNKVTLIDEVDSTWLDFAQHQQDTGHTWREAVDGADTVTANW